MNDSDIQLGEGSPIAVASAATDALSLERKLQDFKFYFLDRNDVVVTVRDFGAKDDQTALDEAEKFRRSHTIEVCCGERRVGRLERLAAPPKRRAKVMAAL